MSVDKEATLEKFCCLPCSALLNCCQWVRRSFPKTLV